MLLTVIAGPAGMSVCVPIRYCEAEFAEKACSPIVTTGGIGLGTKLSGRFGLIALHPAPVCSPEGFNFGSESGGGLG